LDKSRVCGQIFADTKWQNRVKSLGLIPVFIGVDLERMCGHDLEEGTPIYLAVCFVTVGGESPLASHRSGFPERALFFESLRLDCCKGRCLAAEFAISAEHSGQEKPGHHPCKPTSLMRGHPYAQVKLQPDVGTLYHSITRQISSRHWDDEYVRSSRVRKCVFRPCHPLHAPVKARVALMIPAIQTVSLNETPYKP
jgi:hypothetical protein